MHTKGNERNGRTNGTTTKAAGDYSVVGAAPPGSMQQVRFANGSRGGRAAALGVHTGAREGERQERTHKRNEHEFGPISTPLTGYNVLYGAVKRPDKHSPHGQCAIRCREEARLSTPLTGNVLYGAVKRNRHTKKQKHTRGSTRGKKQEHTRGHT
jgi:hypothetical protein